MKVDINDIIPTLQEIQNQQGDLKLFLVIGLIVILTILFIYIKYFTKSIAEEASKKSLSLFESKLSENLQTQIGLFFRDESLRTNLLSHIGIQSIDKKLECWKELQKMYFKYQKIWNFSKDTQSKEYVDLDNELEEIRTKFFIETVYIGYFLSQKMIKLNSLMRNNIRNKRTEVAYSGNNYQLYNENKLQYVLKQQHENEQKISELMYKVEKWIIDKLHSDQTIENFEFTKEQLEQIKKEREKKFENIENS